MKHDWGLRGFVATRQPGSGWGWKTRPIRIGQLGRDKMTGFSSSSAVKSRGGGISGRRDELRRLLKQTGMRFERSPESCSAWPSFSFWSVGSFVLPCCVLCSCFTTSLSFIGVVACWLRRYNQEPLIILFLLFIDTPLESVEVPSDAKEACRRGGDGDGEVPLRFPYQVGKDDVESSAELPLFCLFWRLEKMGIVSVKGLIF